MEGDQSESPSMEFADTENDLHHILSTFVDSENEINNFSTSNYVAMADIQSIFQTGQRDSVIATLNIQNINAKFDNLYAIMNNLSASGQYVGTVCRQETWLTSDADVTLFDIPTTRQLLTLMKLKKPNSSSFQFEYTDVPSVQNIIKNLKPKSSVGHDNISFKLFRQIGDIVAYPLSIIINQSLCTGILPNWLKSYLCTKKMTINSSEIITPYPLLSSLSMVFEKIVFDQLYDNLITNGFYSKANTVSGNNTLPS